MLDSSFKIGNRIIGPDQPAYVIAEVGQAHDGSLGNAHSFIEIAAQAGADAIKFQTHIADAESTYDDTFRIKFSQQDETRFDYWKRMEFTAEQWQSLYNHCKEAGITFLSSPFSEAAIELLSNIGVPAWKVGSGETVSGVLLEKMELTGLPILVSTGISRWQEIDGIYSRLSDGPSPFALFQCTSKYPTPMTEIGLNNVTDMLARYAVPIGLSDHSASPIPSIAAMTSGASLIEVHITMDKRAFGPDTSSSLLPEDLALVCRARDELHTMKTNPVDKDALCDALSGMRGLFTKSLAPASDLKKGHVLSDQDIALKKPGSGIPPDKRAELVGQRLTRDVSKRRLFRNDDFS